MKRLRLFPLLLVLIALAACGTNSAPAAPASEEPAAFGTAVTAEPAQDASEAPAARSAAPAPMGTLTEQDAGPGNVTEQDAGPARTAALSLGQTLKAAACACWLDELEYDAQDPIYFWRAVDCLVSLAGTDDPAVAEEDGFLRLAAADVDPYIRALFGGYEGQYPSCGEENPFVAEDYRDGVEYYVFTRRDLSYFSIELDTAENSAVYAAHDGSRNGIFRLLEDGEQVNQYDVVYREDSAGSYLLSVTDKFVAGTG